MTEVKYEFECGFIGFILVLVENACAQVDEICDPDYRKGEKEWVILLNMAPVMSIMNIHY